MATPAGLDLSKAGLAAGPKTLGLGSGQSSGGAGVWDLLKDSKPAIKLLQIVLASLRMPKREFSRLKPPKHATHELAGGVWDSRQGQQAGTGATGTSSRDAGTQQGPGADTDGTLATEGPAETSGVHGT